MSEQRRPFTDVDSDRTEGVDEVAERAERASRETDDLGPREDIRDDGTYNRPQGGVGGTAGAPPSGSGDSQEDLGGTGHVGPQGSARPGESPGGAPSEGPDR